GEAGVMVTPKPFRAGGPPIWIGGVVDAAVRRAGEIADGFLASIPPWDRETLERQCGALRALERPLSVGLHLPGFVWDGAEEPLDVVRYSLWYALWKYGDALGAHGPRAGQPLPAAPPPPDDWEPPGVIGRPEQVLERLRELAPLLSADGHLVARSYFP